MSIGEPSKSHQGGSEDFILKKVIECQHRILGLPKSLSQPFMQSQKTSRAVNRESSNKFQEKGPLTKERKHDIFQSITYLGSYLGMSLSFGRCVSLELSSCDLIIFCTLVPASYHNLEVCLLQYASQPSGKQKQLESQQCLIFYSSHFTYLLRQIGRQNVGRQNVGRQVECRQIDRQVGRQ